MEISYLNFEVKDLRDKDMATILKGKTIYDPLERSLVFYDADENLLFTRSLEKISIIPHFLKEYKLVFKDEELGGDKLISIECDKKESIDVRSYRYLLNKIIEKENKFKKEDKDDTR